MNGAEPMVAFYHAVMRPAWGDLERPGRGAEVWRRMRQTFASKVVGPHFERVCRDWTRWYAAQESLGGYPRTVGSGSINDRAGRALHEVDVVALSQEDAGRAQVLCIGEAKWNTMFTPGHLERLARVRDLLQDHPTARSSERTKFVFFSGAGFSAELMDVAARSANIVLVDLQRLCGGD